LRYFIYVLLAFDEQEGMLRRWRTSTGSANAGSISLNPGNPNKDRPNNARLDSTLCEALHNCTCNSKKGVKHIRNIARAI